MLHTTGIHDLALELIQEIVLCARWDGGEPPKSDLKTLRQISRSFKHATDPLLFSEISFNFIRRPLGSVVDQLNDLATQATPASRYTRTLDIQCTQVQQLDNPDVYNPITHGRFSMLLLYAVKALHNLRSVRWNLGSLEGLYAVLDGLAELERLEELDLNFVSLPTLLQTPDMIVLRRFKGRLRSIKIHGAALSPDLSQSLLLQLQRMNQTSPSLEVLEYDVPSTISQPAGQGVSNPGGCILHDIVKGVPGTSPLKLKRLRVNGWCLRLDSITLPHLKRLTHLDVNQYPLKHHRLAHMWNMLNQEGIHLRSIRTDTFNDAFISYLLSYTGLEDLWMTHNQDVVHGPRSVRAIVGDLYTSALPHHKDTLKVFKELNRADAAHCASTDYMVALQNCPRLEVMMITVDTAELSLPEKTQETLISALNIPSLRILDLDYTRTPRPRLGHRCSCRNLNSWRSNNRRLDTIIKSLDILGSVHRSLSSCQIIFDRRRYFVKQDENGALGFQPDEPRIWPRLKTY